jgi:hypothetical protein
MPGSKSDYLEAALLNHVLGGTVLTPPATIYIALYTATPSDAGGGTEVVGGSYTRLAITNNATNWPAASGTTPTTKSNGVAFTFPAATADWGLIVAFGIFDAVSGGNLLYWGPLNANKSVLNGDTADFAAGSLLITED